MTTNKEIIAAAYASFASGDVPSVLAAMDSKIEWTEAEGWPLGGSPGGRRRRLHAARRDRRELSVNVTQLVAEDDTVVGLGTASWNRNGSGEPAEVKIAHVWTLADGKITRFQQHIDTAKARDLNG